MSPEEMMYCGPMPCRRAGNSGLFLPVLSLGFWYNFGGSRPFHEVRDLVLTAFDQGICHLDLANGYGPPLGAAEEHIGRLLRGPLRPRRDEICIATKAGWDAWPGPYGDGGSRIHLMASLDQSLRRLKCDHIDLFYHHRPDPGSTPLEETMACLADMVRSGKVRYIGLSSYPSQLIDKAQVLLKGMGYPAVVSQDQFSLLYPENTHKLDQLEHVGMGMVAFAPLAQGLLTGKYRTGIHTGTRGALDKSHLSLERLEPLRRNFLDALTALADEACIPLNQIAYSWLLRQKNLVSAVMGIRTKVQLLENLSLIKRHDPGEDFWTQVESLRRNFAHE